MIDALSLDKVARILLVEDDGEMRDLLADTLLDEGYQVTQARDGEEAFQEVARESFDLVITDMRMPRMGGLDLLPLIKKACPGIPVILITSFEDASTLAEAYKMGVFGYMTKPFRIVDFKNAVRKALNREARWST